MTPTPEDIAALEELFRSELVDWDPAVRSSHDPKHGTTLELDLWTHTLSLGFVRREGKWVTADDLEWPVATHVWPIIASEFERMRGQREESKFFLDLQRVLGGIDATRTDMLRRVRGLIDILRAYEQARYGAHFEGMSRTLETVMPDHEKFLAAVDAAEQAAMRQPNPQAAVPA